MPVRVCELELGAEPWAQLTEGPVVGRIAMDGREPLTAEIRIRGAHSRRFDKKSLQVTLRGERLADGPPEGHTVRRIHLNADYVDPALMRSALSFGLFEAMGVPAPRCEHVAVMMNGAYAGTYLKLESVDTDFCRRRGWTPGDIYYAVNRNANFGLISPFSREVKPSLAAGYKPLGKAGTAPLQQMVMQINLASDDEFPRTVMRRVDVEGYLRWLAVAVFVGNRDGFVHNYALYRDPESGRFRIIPWDYDATFGIDVNGRPARLDRVPVTGWNKLSHRLMADTGFRQRYRGILREGLDGVMAPAALAAEIDRISRDAGEWIDMDIQKRGLSTTLAGETARLVRWAEERRDLLLRELDRL